MNSSSEDFGPMMSAEGTVESTQLKCLTCIFTPPPTDPFAMVIWSKSPFIFPADRHKS